MVEPPAESDYTDHVGRRLIVVGILAAIVGAALLAWLGGANPERADGWSPPEPPEAEAEAEGLRFVEGELDPSDSPGARPPADAGRRGPARPEPVGRDPFGYDSPREREARERARQDRVRRHLELVDTLLEGIETELAVVEREGDAERQASLTTTRDRLLTRRAALRDSLSEAAADEADEADEGGEADEEGEANR